MAKVNHFLLRHVDLQWEDLNVDYGWFYGTFIPIYWKIMWTTIDPHVLSVGCKQCWHNKMK